jgi:hypothetical protein
MFIRFENRESERGRGCECHGSVSGGGGREEELAGAADRVLAEWIM